MSEENKDKLPACVYYDSSDEEGEINVYKSIRAHSSGISYSGAQSALAAAEDTASLPTREEYLKYLSTTCLDSVQKPRDISAIGTREEVKHVAAAADAMEIDEVKKTRNNPDDTESLKKIAPTPSKRKLVDDGSMTDAASADDIAAKASSRRSCVDTVNQTLALAMHNYADRVFNTGPVREAYLVAKKEYFAATIIDKGKLHNAYKALRGTKDDPFAPPTLKDDELETHLTPEAVKALITTRTKPEVDMTAAVPELRLKPKGTELLLRMLSHEGVSLDPPSKAIEMAHAAKPPQVNKLVESELLRRAGKNLSRKGGAAEADVNGTVTIRHSPITSTSVSVEAHHPSQKVTTFVKGVTSYVAETPIISQHSAALQSAIIYGTDSTKATSFIGTTEEFPTETAARMKLANLATLISVVEVHRNKTTAFTTPMFLECQNIADGDDASRKARAIYPMALAEHSAVEQGAVECSRAVRVRHTSALPNPKSQDDATPKALELQGAPEERLESHANRLLKPEAELLKTWADTKSAKGDPNAAAICCILEDCALADAATVKLKNLDRIKNTAQKLVECYERHKLNDVGRASAADGAAKALSLDGMEEYHGSCIRAFNAAGIGEDEITELQKFAKEDGNKASPEAVVRALNKCGNELKNIVMSQQVVGTAIHATIDLIDQHILEPYYGIKSPFPAITAAPALAHSIDSDRGPGEVGTYSKKSEGGSDKSGDRDARAPQHPPSESSTGSAGASTPPAAPTDNAHTSSVNALNVNRQSLRDSLENPQTGPSSCAAASSESAYLVGLPSERKKRNAETKPSHTIQECSLVATGNTSPAPQQTSGKTSPNQNTETGRRTPPPF